MIHLTRALVRRWLDALLHIDDTPERTAAAFALGVFFGFSPFLGLHTVLAIAFAFLLNLNRVAVLLGVYSNLPWIIAPYYAFATMVGAPITRAPDSAGIPLAARRAVRAVAVSRRSSGTGSDRHSEAVCSGRTPWDRCSAAIVLAARVSARAGVRDKPAADS